MHFLVSFQRFHFFVWSFYGAVMFSILPSALEIYLEIQINKPQHYTKIINKLRQCVSKYIIILKDIYFEQRDEKICLKKKFDDFFIHSYFTSNKKVEYY